MGVLSVADPPGAANVNSHSWTVHIIDDDRGLRCSLAFLLEAAGYTPRVYASGESFLDGGAFHAGDCLILDIRLDGMDGLELLETLRRRGIRVPVICVSAYADVRIVAHAFRRGAVDFVEKPCPPDLLLGRVEEVFKRIGREAQEETQHETMPRRLEDLTVRERQVMDLLVQGQTVRQVADQLGLSHKTVQVHRAHILDKLNADSVPELLWELLTCERCTSFLRPPEV